MKVALDIGYSNVKLVYGSSPASLERKIFPAAAGPMALRDQSLGGHVEGGVTVEVEGQAYSAFVDPARFQQYARPLHEQYVGTPTYQALFLAALKTVEVPRIERLVTGLPTRHAMDAARRQAVRSLMLGKHVVGGSQVEVCDVQVIAQPVGAFIDFLYAQRSHLPLRQNVLVVDPGFGSVDWAMIHQGNLRALSSDSSFQAMSVVLEKAVAKINARLGSRITVERLETALRLGETEIVVFGEPLAVAQDIQAASLDVVPTVVAELLRRVRTDSGQVDCVLLTGGGAPFFIDGIRAAVAPSPVVLAEDPVFANARGYWFSSHQQPGGQSTGQVAA